MAAAMDPRWIALAIPAVMLAVFVILRVTRYRKVGPNEALIVSGFGKTEKNARGRVVRRGYRVVIGGGTFVWPFLERADVVSLEVRSIECSIGPTPTAQGIPAILGLKGLFKVRGDAESVAAAAERFLSMEPPEIARLVQEKLDGHVKSAVGRATMEALFGDREGFARGVIESGAADFAAFGVEIVALVVREITDPQGYLENLAKVAVKSIGAVVCDACGGPVSSGPPCPACGMPVHPASRYCGQCGKPRA